MNGTWYHVETYYPDGEIQDEFFVTKSARQDYVSYMKRLGYKTKLYTSKSIGSRNKNAIRSWDIHMEKNNAAANDSLPWH